MSQSDLIRPDFFCLESMMALEALWSRELELDEAPWNVGRDGVADGPVTTDSAKAQGAIEAHRGPAVARP
jgi:hypothetical protein